MEPGALYCNPFNPRMLSVVVATGYRQETFETNEDETASVIAHDSLRLPGHERRTI